jgi:predicted nucleotidyltransferase
LKLLKERDVEFVVIGASAFAVHGYSRATLDLDLFVRPDPENIRKLMGALKVFGYDLSDVTEEDLLKKKVLIRQYLLETDIHPFVKGVTYPEVWAGRVKGNIGGADAFFAGLKELIRMKEAAGRAKDLEDLKVLRALPVQRP